METDESMKNKAQEQEKKGATEDPPVNVTEQNKQGKSGSEEIKVPKEALENYKQNASDTEE